ncbi:alpha/beta fold hydrolase [Streptomyces sp. B1866]|uniref:alpha/beta fold hydrolase n=1 Tax=Streptomyces sp. B1866 TaxID=3075431 RepID=UPI0028901E47|nr:alpha/beta fold hydrolase [Streptomyces sp. B1866]MDT3399146.1 alpha/beta fold hydrolase [Streptomyces sp. B1866]
MTASTRPRQPVVVRRARPAAGPPDGAASSAPVRVLLVHGLASSARVWDRFLPLAGPGCELWTAELPWRGCGVTGWSGRPAADWLDHAVAEVPGGPDVIVGHSFGANALLAWLDGDGGAEAARRALRGAVLVSPFYRPQEDRFDWAALSYYLNEFDRIIADGLRVSAGGSLDQRLCDAMARKIRDRVGPYGWLRFIETYLHTPRLRVRRLRVPFLIVGGETDFAAFPADARELGRALPDAHVRILPDVGHFTMVERAGDFAHAVNGFLRTLTARPRPDAPLPSMECT